VVRQPGTWQFKSTLPLSCTFIAIRYGKLTHILRCASWELAIQVNVASILHIRGLQCFKLNGNHTENYRYWQKNDFLLFAKCLKMYSFFRICILRYKSAIMTQKFFFLKNINMGIKKTQNFMLISNSLISTQTNAP
jgi:hypothetical protein